MSFEGVYQFVCKDGCYYERDVYEFDIFDDNKKKCFCGKDIIFQNLVDETNGESGGYISIPVTSEDKVRKDFFDRYLKYPESREYLKKRKEILIPPYMFYVDKLSLEKIVELFSYFDRNCVLRMESSKKYDEGHDLVNYDFVVFGDNKYFEDDREIFEPLYIDKYGMPVSSDAEDAYECCEYSYDWDLRSVVIELYKQMWMRSFVPEFRRKDFINQNAPWNM